MLATTRQGDGQVLVFAHSASLGKRTTTQVGAGSSTARDAVSPPDFHPAQHRLVEPAPSHLSRARTLTLSDRRVAEISFLFFFPLYLQALLLHPVFPDPISIPLRLLLTGPTLFLAVAAPFSTSFEPRRDCHGLNFVLGVLSLSQAWRALEWGLVKDRTPYTWVGYPDVSDDAEGTSGSSSSASSASDDKQSPTPAKRLSSRPTRAQLAALRAQSAQNDSPIEILYSSWHLAVSPRGVGYAFAPPPTSLARPFPRNTFLLDTLKYLVGAHLTVISCVAWVLADPSERRAVVAYAVPAPLVDFLAEFSASMATGIAVFAGLALGFYLISLPSFLITVALKQPFDPRAYPSLLNRPHRAQSVAELWSARWHAIFSRSFRFLGFEPATKVAVRLGLGKAVGRTVGVLLVFGASGLLHEHGLYTATYDMRKPSPSGTLLERWGVMAYFLLQGVAIVFEGLFTGLTGRKVGGPLGVLWTLLVCCASGVLVHRAWVAGDLLLNLPKVQNWSWERFLLPLVCMLPPPFATR